MRNNLICLGVGDGWSSSDRGHAAFVYRFGKTSLLVDCGEPADGTFRACGLEQTSIDAAVLSHLHADHFGGLFMFLQGSWLGGRTRDLPLYLPRHAIRPLRAMLDAAMLWDRLLGFKLRLRPVLPRRSFQVNELRVTPHPTTHLDGLRRKFGRNHPGVFSSFCFLIQGAGRRVGHSADIGKPDDLEPLVAEPLDLLVCELAHFAPESMFSYLRGRAIRKIAFVHLSGEHWANLPRTRRLAKQMLGNIPHTFARDGDVVEF